MKTQEQINLTLWQVHEHLEGCETCAQDGMCEDYTTLAWEVRSLQFQQAGELARRVERKVEDDK